MNDRIAIQPSTEPRPSAPPTYQQPPYTPTCHPYTDRAALDIPSVHPDRSSVENPHSDTPDQDYRFRRHRQTRHDLLEIVPRSSLTPKQKERFLACGSEAWIQWSQTAKRYRVACNRCNLRFCPACCRSLAQQTRDYIIETLTDDRSKRWRFLTLTLRASSDPLATTIAKLRKAFRRLRQRAFWKQHTRGGIAVLETKVGENSNQWHTHLHVLMHGRFMPQRKLKREWLTCTRTSTIVDIRPVNRPSHAAEYVTKYLTKPPPTEVLTSAERFSEYVDAFRYTKLVSRFGKMPKPKSREERDDYPRDWQTLSSLQSVIDRAQCGDTFCQSVLKALTGGPSDEPIHPDLRNKSPTTLPAMLQTDQ